MPQPSVILFSSLLLPSSQTFVRAQGEELQRFTPYYVGSRLVPGLDLPAERTIVINNGGILGTTAEALFKGTGYAPTLFKQVQQLQPVLIHAQFGLSGALALPLAQGLNLPMIVHFRGADATVKAEHTQFTSINHWLYFRRRETLKRKAQLFIAVSKFIQNKLLEQGFPPEKVIAHYSGIDVNAFQADPAISRERVVLFVGRLTEKKGCEYLIQAMAQVQKVLPDVQLVIIGDGPLKSNLEALAAKQLHRYTFLGLQPFPIVKNWMNRSLLLAAPSVTSVQGDAEGLPNVVLEAQAMGLPVVSTMHAGIPEAIVHGETGFLVQERESEELTQYILKLLQSHDLWQSFSFKGREQVEVKFSRRQQTQILERIYETVIETFHSKHVDTKPI